MIKMIAAVCRRPGMTHGEYIAYIHRVHADIARAQRITLQHYTQNHVFDAAFGTRGEITSSQVRSRDSVTELYWEDFQRMGETFAHPYTQQTVGPDGANFADLPLTVSMIADEVDLPVPAPGPANAKVMHFLKKRTELDLAEFFARWRAAHITALEEEPLVASAMRRIAHSQQNPQGDALLKYFGGAEEDRYAGVASIWFDDESTVGLFRRYEAALLRVNAQPDKAFYLPEASFFVYAKEVDIL